MMNSFQRKYSIPIIISPILVLTLASTVRGMLVMGARGITVTTTTDESDGSCDDGDCSLRDAINTASAGDTIILSDVTYTLSIPRGLEADADGFDGTVGDLDIEAPPTPTNTPTRVPPTPTNTPTRVPPTPTNTPTPTPTNTPTLVPPTPTNTPTRVPPTPTNTPTPTPTNTPTPVPPPALVAISPVSNTHGATIASAVSITYDQNMDSGAVGPQTFAVHAMQTGLISQTYSVNGGTISLTPANSFKPGELVQVTATTATLSILDTGPVSPTVWQFRTKAGIGPAIFNELTGTFGITSGNSRAVALGDVNGDGHLDAVVANVGAAQDVHLNDGSGIFGLATTFGSGDSRGVTLGDVDGDGDLDAVVANWGAAQDVHLNDGSGLFSPTADSAFGGGGSWNVTLGDVDGDGDLDAVVANWGAAQDVHFNDGSGAFSSIADSTFGGGGSWAAVLGDVDGDGDLDAVVANNNAAQDVHLNDGSGNFGAAITFGSGASRAVALGDVNGDGHLDAVVANLGAAQDVHLNDGSGNFGAATTFGLANGSSWNVALGDIDGDGHLDAVVANSNAVQDVYLNNGSGSFAITTTFGLSGGNSYGVALGDVDGDGDLDAVVANNSAAQEVAFNEGPPDLGFVKSIAPGAATVAPGSLLTYTLTFSNAGDVPAENVVITDTLPASITVQSVSSGGDVVITRTLSNQTFEVFDVSKVSPGQGGVITITARLGSSLGAGDTITNTATITSTTAETNTGNNIAEIGLTVQSIAPVTYTLSVIVSPTVGGVVTLDPPGDVYEAGSVVTLTADAASAYTFSAWSGDVISTSNPISVTMTLNATVTATFEQAEFKIYMPLVLRNQ